VPRTGATNAFQIRVRQPFLRLHQHGVESAAVSDLKGKTGHHLLRWGTPKMYMDKGPLVVWLSTVDTPPELDSGKFDEMIDQFETYIEKVFFPGVPPLFVISFQFITDKVSQKEKILLTARVDEKAFAKAVVVSEDVDFFIEKHKYNEPKRTYQGGDDWTCEYCGYENYAKRDVCRTCCRNKCTGRTATSSHEFLYFRRIEQDPIFKIWLIDTQKRLAFGTEEIKDPEKKTIQSRKFLPPGAFFRRFTEVFNVLKKKKVDYIRHCCVNYSCEKWMRKDGFHLKCFIEPRQYIDQFIPNSDFGNDRQKSIIAKVESELKQYEARFKKDNKTAGAVSIYYSEPGAVVGGGSAPSTGGADSAVGGGRASGSASVPENAGNGGADMTPEAKELKKVAKKLREIARLEEQLLEREATTEESKKLAGKPELEAQSARLEPLVAAQVRIRATGDAAEPVAEPVTNAAQASASASASAGVDAKPAAKPAAE
jgi:hypothetical protein